MEQSKANCIGFAYTKNAEKPQVMYGDSKEEILDKLQEWNKTRSKDFTYDTCNIGTYNPAADKYENYQKFDVHTRQNISKIYLQVPERLRKEDFQNMLNFFKENGAKFNSYKKAWYIEPGQEEIFKDYLPWKQEPEKSVSMQPKAPEAEQKKEQSVEAAPGNSGIQIKGFEMDGIYGTTYMANYTYNGKDMQSAVQEQGDDYYITTGSKHAGDWMRHNFTPEERQAYEAFQSVRYAALDSISGLDKQYVIELKNGKSLKISESEMLQKAGVAKAEELTGIKMMDAIEKTVMERMQMPQKPGASEAGDTGQKMPKEELQIGDQVTLRVPEYEKVNGFDNICGMKTLQGELKEITSDKYTIQGKDGQVVKVAVEEVYNDRQAEIMNRALKQLTPEEIDMVGQPSLSAAQMEQVFNGLQDGLGAEMVALYASPSIESWQMDIYRYGMGNGISFYNIKDVVQGNAMKPAGWEDSRNMVDRMVKAQRNLIIKDLKENGVRPEKQLVRKIEKLNGITNKMNHVQGILSEAKNARDAVSETGKLKKEIASDVGHQKKQMKAPAISNNIPCR